MKRLYLHFIMILIAGAVVGCSNDDESDRYDHAYKVSYFDRDPNINQRQGYWVREKFIELTPEKEPPFTLLVKWNDAEGEKAFNYIVGKKDDVVMEKYRIDSNTAVIICKKYIICPYLFVSSSYKSSTTVFEKDYLRIDNRILLKMKAGKSVEAIADKYADVLTLDTDNELTAGVEAFDCKLKTSCEVLQLADEIKQRDDVEWAEPNMYAPYYAF
ncbi:MAG: hypothetical protein J5965_00685 [Aeriscardovia sp.]|nr:hypothetical protein [Aeriscardovia sp.]MBP3220083.1 hypothetical protein [Prevotella sp.]